MKASKYIQINSNVLLEYIYDDGNNISEQYSIVINSKNNTSSFVSASASTTNNTQSNQLFNIDPSINNFGLVDSTVYPYLQLKNYAQGFPVQYDTLRIHFPVNYIFGQNLGFYVNVYGFDVNNANKYGFSNIYFDISNISQSYLINYTTPAFLFNGTSWGKNVTVNFPSLYAVSNQIKNGSPSPYSINSNLTNGIGISVNSPIFIDFYDIISKKTLNGVTTYYMDGKTSVSFPLSPDFENIGLVIEQANDGDYYDIYGTFNGDIGDFSLFIQNSYSLGANYYVSYTITLYEQNIITNTQTITITNNFGTPITHRPIIKNSTTTAVIDVVMNVIDNSSKSSITRRASYGMLSDEVAKYSLNLTKINLSNASKPVIYNIKNAAGAGIFGNNTGNNSNNSSNNNGLSNTRIIYEPITVNNTILADKFNVVCKSDNVLIGKDNYWGENKILIEIDPFDNILQFIIAQDVSNVQKSVNAGNGTKLEYVSAPQFLDMSSMGTINMVIKSTSLTVTCPLYIASNQVNLSLGVTVFKVTSSQINDVRTIYNAGYNVFYITSTLNNTVNVIYKGLFVMSDSLSNINNLNSIANQLSNNALNNPAPSIINDPNNGQTGTAIVTRTIVQSTNISATQSTAISAATSVSSSTVVSGITYTVSTVSSLIVDGYEWTSAQIQGALGLKNAQTNLSIIDTSLYSNGQLLGSLSDISNALQAKYLTTTSATQLYNATQQAFK